MMTRRQMSASMMAALAAAWAGTADRLSGQAPAAKPATGVKTLMQEPLAAIPNAEVSVITLTVAPGASSKPHQHTGPVFAYILRGAIENQVDPNPPQTYREGDYFYEPAMHVHRELRNLSPTEPATLLIFQVGEKGKRFTLAAQ